MAKDYQDKGACDVCFGRRVKVIREVDKNGKEKYRELPCNACGGTGRRR